MKLHIENLSKNFDNKVILKDANFTFEKGKIYGLLGRNGSGKTTLFNCISKNLTFEGGQITLETDNQTTTEYDMTDIGYVYATPHLPAFMTGYEFIKFFIEINKAKITHPLPPEAYLNQVGIMPEDMHRLLKDYSHGMQNKVQMLSTMLTQPPVLLLDEPLTSFDVVAAHEMKELIIKEKENSIVIFSTHILQLAQDLCDEIVLLHHKTLRQVDSSIIHTKEFEEDVVEMLSEKEGNEGNRNRPVESEELE